MTTFLGVPGLGARRGLRQPLPDRQGRRGGVHRQRRAAGRRARPSGPPLRSTTRGCTRASRRRRAELERAVRGLEATSAISRAVGFETELGRVLELIVKRGRAMSEARSFLVLLQQDDDLRVEAAAGEVGARDRRHDDRRPPTRWPGAVAAERRRRARPRSRGSRGARARRHRGDARSAVVVPLGFRGRARGVLIALDRMREGPAFDAEDEHLLGVVRRQRRHRDRDRAVGGGGTAAPLDARLGGGARPLGARAARRHAAGARRPEGAAGLRSADAGSQGGSRRPSTQALAQIELSIRGLQGADHRAAPGRPRPDRPRARRRGAVKRVGATSGLDVEPPCAARASTRGISRRGWIPRSRGRSTGSPRSRSPT